MTCGVQDVTCGVSTMPQEEPVEKATCNIIAGRALFDDDTFESIVDVKTPQKDLKQVCLETELTRNIIVRVI